MIWALARINFDDDSGRICGRRRFGVVANLLRGGRWRHRGRPTEMVGRARGLRAQTMLAARGMMAVFLTRWLFSPLGLWMNLLARSARFHLGTFTAASVAGEAVWAGLHIGVGYGFASNIAAASDMLGSILGFTAAGAAAWVLGLWLRAALHAHPQKTP